MSINNARTIEGLREMIVTKASETTLANSQYDFGHVNGWLGALYWANEIDRDVMDELKNEANAAFAKAVANLYVG